MEKTMEKQPGFFKRNYKTILYSFTAVLAVAIIITMWYNSTHEVNPLTWLGFWKYCMTFLYFISFPVVLWFIIGGLVDLKKMIAILKQEKLDEKDDGYVRKEDKPE